MSGPDDDRRSLLLAAKLRALLREQLGVETDPRRSPHGAAATHGDDLWILSEHDPATLVGGVVSWGARAGAERTHLVLDAGTSVGVAERRARLLGDALVVWEVDGHTLRRAAPAPFPDSPPVPTEALDVAARLVEAGAEVVIEHGVVRGEVLGLEVARVVVDEGGARLEVGVGRHDREAFAMFHGPDPSDADLVRVVTTVREHRSDPARHHPLARLAPARLVLHELLARPEAFDLVDPRVVEATLPTASLLDDGPAFARARTTSGDQVVIGCAVGVDLELVPAAVDARAWHAPDAHLHLVLADRDVHPAIERLAALAQPVATIHALPDRTDR